MMIVMSGVHFGGKQIIFLIIFWSTFSTSPARLFSSSSGKKANVGNNAVMNPLVLPALGGKYVALDDGIYDKFLFNNNEISEMYGSSTSKKQKLVKIVNTVLKSSFHNKVTPQPFPCTDLDRSENVQLVTSGKDNVVSLCELCPLIPFLEKIRNVRPSPDLKPILSLTSISTLTSCLVQCLKRPGQCLAVNHDQKTRICSLYDQTGSYKQGSGQPSVRDEGSVQVVVTQPSAIIRDWVYSANTRINMTMGHKNDQNVKVSVQKSTDFPSCLAACDSHHQHQNDRGGGQSEICVAVSFEISSKNCFQIISPDFSPFLKINLKSHEPITSVEYRIGNLAAFRLNEILPSIANVNSGYSHFWRFKPLLWGKAENEFFEKKFKFTSLPPSSQSHTKGNGGISSSSCGAGVGAAGCDLKTGNQRCRYPENLPPFKDTRFPICPDSRHAHLTRILERRRVLEKCLVDCLLVTNSRTCVGVKFLEGVGPKNDHCQLVHLQNLRNEPHKPHHVASKGRDKRETVSRTKAHGGPSPQTSVVDEGQNLFFALQLPLQPLTKTPLRYQIGRGLEISREAEKRYPSKWLTKKDYVTSIDLCMDHCTGHRDGGECNQFLYNFKLNICRLFHPEEDGGQNLQKISLPLEFNDESVYFSKIPPLNSIRSLFSSELGYEILFEGMEQQSSKNGQMRRTTEILTNPDPLGGGSQLIDQCLVKCLASGALCGMVSAVLNFDFSSMEPPKVMSVSCSFFDTSGIVDTELATIRLKRSSANAAIFVKQEVSVEDVTNFDHAFSQSYLNQIDPFQDHDFPTRCFPSPPSLSYQNLDDVFNSFVREKELAAAPHPIRHSKSRHHHHKGKSQNAADADDAANAKTILDHLVHHLEKFAEDPSSPLVKNGHAPSFAKLFAKNEFLGYDQEDEISEKNLVWQVPVLKKPPEKKPKAGSEAESPAEESESNIFENRQSRLLSFGGLGSGLKLLGVANDDGDHQVAVKSVGAAPQNLKFKLDAFYTIFEPPVRMMQMMRSLVSSIRTPDRVTANSFTFQPETVKTPSSLTGSKGSKRPKRSIIGNELGMILEEIKIAKNKFICGTGTKGHEKLSLPQCDSDQWPQYLTFPFCWRGTNGKGKSEWADIKFDQRSHCKPQDCRPLDKSGKSQVFGVKVRHPTKKEFTHQRIYSYIAKFSEIHKLRTGTFKKGVPQFTVNLVNDENYFSWITYHARAQESYVTPSSTVAAPGSTKFKVHRCLDTEGLKEAQADPDDFTGDGKIFNRGHLTPNNILSTLGPEAVASSYLMVNVAPQDEYTNKGPWKGLEQDVEIHLKNFHGIVATGVCPPTLVTESWKTMLGLNENFPPIPSCYWKLVCCTDNFKSSTTTTKVHAFFAENSYTGVTDKEAETIDQEIGENIEKLLTKIQHEISTIDNKINERRSKDSSQSKDENEVDERFKTEFKNVQTDPGIYTNFKKLRLWYLNFLAEYRKAHRSLVRDHIVDQEDIIKRLGWTDQQVLSMWEDAGKYLTINRDSGKIPSAIECACQRKAAVAPSYCSSGAGQQQANKKVRLRRRAKSNKKRVGGGKTATTTTTTTKETTEKKEAVVFKNQFGGTAVDKREHFAFQFSVNFGKEENNFEPNSKKDKTFHSASCGKRLVGYVDALSPLSTVTFVQALSLTHIIYSYFPVNDDGSLDDSIFVSLFSAPQAADKDSKTKASSKKSSPAPPIIQQKNLKRFLGKVSQFRHLKSMFVVGGPAKSDSDRLSLVTADPIKRTRLVISIVATIFGHPQHEFDGVDIHWAHFSSPADARNYYKFVRQLRSTLDAYYDDLHEGKKGKKLISIVGPSDKINIDYGMMDGRIFPLIDWLNILPTDGGAHTQFEWYTGPPNPLFGPKEKDGGWWSQQENAHWTLNYYDTVVKVSRQKLSMAIPFYGNQWTKGLNFHLGDGTTFQKWPTSTATRSSTHAHISFREIVKMEQDAKRKNCQMLHFTEAILNSPTDQQKCTGDRAGGDGKVDLTFEFHPQARVPFLWDQKDRRRFLGYESPLSIQKKEDYAKEFGLGGFSIWTIDQDSVDYALLTSLVNADLCSHIGKTGGEEKQEQEGPKVKNKNVLVRLKESTAPVLQNLAKEKFKNREDRATKMTIGLGQFTQQSQKELMTLLTQKKATSSPQILIQPLWILNGIMVRNCDPELVKILRVFKGVESVEEEKLDPWEEAAPVSTPLMATSGDGVSFCYPKPSSLKQFFALFTTSSDDAQSKLTWGLKTIGVKWAWDQQIRGQNVIIGVIDSGVKLEHEAIQQNYLNEPNSWLDPLDQSPTPVDMDGHGTHVTGTILGLNGIGVAPESKWIGCRVGKQNSHQMYLDGYLLCCQFMFCPATRGVTTLSAGLKCGYIPHIINNSWGFAPGTKDFDNIIQSWKVMGIIPVFAIGNDANGPKCGTAMAPGENSMVIGVGAVDIFNDVTSYSRRGDQIPHIKPDIVAPGHQICSAGIKDTTSYRFIDGTSMAAPHVSGLIALMLSSVGITADVPGDFDLVKKALTQSAPKTPKDPSGLYCGYGDIYPSYPNYHTGYGAIDVQKAIETYQNLARQQPGPSQPLPHTADFPDTVRGAAAAAPAAAPVSFTAPFLIIMLAIIVCQKFM